MDDKKILVGGGVLIALLLIIALFFDLGGGDDQAEMKELIAGDLAPVSESVAALDTRMAEMQTAVEGQIAEIRSSMEAQVAELQGKLDSLSGQTAEAVSKADLAAIQTQIEGLASQAADLGSDDPAPAVNGDGASAGETVILAGGALRVFVSRLTEDSARLSVGGEMISLSAGQSRTVTAGDTTCALTLASLSGGAALDATCDGDMGPPEGLMVGQTALLADGALRVFVSGVGDDSARLSVQGSTFELAAGDSTEVQMDAATCTVTLDNVDRGHVTVSGDC
ncbi:MAG: hypothetical protein WBB25_02430 [Sulfitobacter sp.]